MTQAAAPASQPSQEKWPIFRLAAIALAYCCAQSIAFLFADNKDLFMSVWPPAGVCLAALLLSPRRLWPAIAATIFVVGNAVNLFQHLPLLNSLGFMSANIIESLGCAWIITRFCGHGVRFDRVKEVLMLLLAATLVNAGSACVGAGVAAMVSGAAFGPFWLKWLVADGLGILLITPFIILCCDLR
ncbi:MAG: MASE1 domain-containing protein, partial [Candidatus Omnitrophica bacterium]|nr:MASE1 domain-containing protein [Candidatus Omnitrophota bacterium]